MVFPVTSTLLDACVLGVIYKSDTYGYKLTQQLSSAVEVSESTLYPVLKRLQKNGLLVTYDKPFDGRNRRYYHITDEGKVMMEEFQNEWELFKLRIDEIFKGGMGNDN